MSTTTVLNQNWEFAQLSEQKPVDWLPVTQFPTTVHVELLKAGKIPDPFVGQNEWQVQWVGESNWAFRTSFRLRRSDFAASNADLVFDGLDTFAVVQLNGQKILESNNMFVPYRVAVRDHLKEGTNTLLLMFQSTYLKGKDLEKQHGKLALWNGDSSRLHVRKAQYNYGWDWGPVLMTCGPWRPISLHTYTVRITDLRVQTQVSESLDADIKVSLHVSTLTGWTSVTLRDKTGQVVREVDSVVINDGKAEVQFEGAKGEFELWYPVGYGKQPMYSVQVQVTDEAGNCLDTMMEKIGIRRARIVQDKLLDADGRTFLFEINNIRIFAGGSNWIPGDSFLTTLSPNVYRSWLKLLVDGNQLMVRVWGGGIYEADVFYETCDKLGILVWQDFMFGCGQYPAYDDFLNQVTEEAEANVKRLRRHPSVVILAGNNEDYQIAESLHLELDYSDETSDFRKTNFPARHIYERLLPDITSRLSDIHYHRGSPYSGYGKVTTDRTVGDIHQWNVWHGSQEPWHNWDKLSGRFVSEFGMEAFPDIRTVDFWLGGNKDERYPQSKTMEVHNKADGWQRRLELYLMENFKHAFDMESYVYYTQIMQAETLASAYRLWRREWRGRGREYTAGALVWQLNDCWPVTSWAIVDYFLRPKPAYFAIARELRPYTVGITRKEKKTYADECTAAFFTIDTLIEIWGTNKTLEDKKVTLDVAAYNLDDPSWHDRTTEDVILKANSSTELVKGNLPGQERRTGLSENAKPIIVSARLIGDNGEVLGRCANWPEPYKFIKFPPPKELGFKAIVASDGESVELSTERPMKGIVLDVDGEDAKWSDQAIDLVPGDPQVVKVDGLKGRTLKTRYLGDGTA
ncbi:glycoside hydrolase family 2 protein [Gautieria morchelliformis]|nr:glycoside hydrolase family 2 protein [Gautieria morchelliformis]